MSDAKFDEALEAVFEARAREFSPHLREMLEQLWLEGVMEGRARGRLEGAELEKRLDQKVIYESSMSGLEMSMGLELEEVLEAIKKLERQGLTPRVHDELELHIPPFKLESPSIGFEVMGRYPGITSWSSPKMTSASSQRSLTQASSLLSEIVSTSHDASGNS